MTAINAPVPVEDIFDVMQMIEAPVGRADAFGVGKVPVAPEASGDAGGGGSVSAARAQVFDILAQRIGRGSWPPA